MRGIVWIGLMIVLTTICSAQETEGWRQFAKESIGNHVIDAEQTLLVEGPRERIRSLFNSYQILRSIDRTHHIVKGIISQPAHGLWNVNDAWKLDLSKDNKNSLFYLVTTDRFKESELDGFNLIKHYPHVNTFLIKADPEKAISILQSNPEVIHLTNKVSSPVVESRVIDMNLNPNRVNKIHHYYPELDGSTETISIQENNFDDTDMDLLGRNTISGLESETIDNHATEMATIIAGAGSSFITGRGVAREARITSSDFFDAMPDANEEYVALGINTQNHSYGINRSNAYGVEARAFDISANQNTSLLHVFSSGNAGNEPASDGVYEGIDGYANLTGNIKMSKNSLVVGSVDTVGAILNFVSRGPTFDGRIKPEVVAYSVVGSSNSAALVSGVSALLQQSYRSENASDMPAALVKALLINGAEDVGAAGPDFITGYGNVNAWRSLKSLQNDQYYQGAVTNGVTDSFVLNLPADALNLKVTICWIDPAANVNDFPALVNDLDLRVVGTTTTLPWILDSNAELADLSKAAIRGVDILNNVEQVTIANAESSYTVEIEGSEVSGTQEFFVAWQYDTLDTFEWDYPTGSDNMPYNGETGSYFRWATTKTGIGVLAYTEDDINWVTLDDAVDITTGSWRWNNPPTIGNEIRARMAIDGDFFETELFTVSLPLSANVGFNCGDSVMLKWHPSSNAINYTVRSLGDQALEEITTTTDTFLVVPNASGFNSTFFSIQPNLPSGKGLLPAPTFDYTLQGIECYVFSFFQTVALDTGIYLNLSLGTTYGIDEIVLERSNSLGYEQIANFRSIDNEIFTYLDELPNQGYNEHRAIIRFINGEELTLSAGTSFYLTDEPLRIFPNPILGGEFFSIITSEFEDLTPIIELVDDRGAIVHQQELQGTQDFIPTEGLRSGMYFYRLYADDEVYVGRVLVR